MAPLRSFLACMLAGLAPLAAPAAPSSRPPELLVARVDLPDPNFHDAVVLLTQQGADGAVGVIVNHPTEVTLAQAFPDEKRLEGADDRIFFGGPVLRDVALFALRSPTPWLGASTILPGVQIGSNSALLHQLLGRDKPTEGLRVFAGLAGWGPGQLEAEIARGDWRRIPADAESIFDAKPETLWRRLYRRAFATQVFDGIAPPVGAPALREARLDRPVTAVTSMPVGARRGDREPRALRPCAVFHCARLRHRLSSANRRWRRAMSGGDVLGRSGGRGEPRLAAAWSGRW